MIGQNRLPAEKQGTVFCFARGKLQLNGVTPRGKSGLCLGQAAKRIGGYAKWLCVQGALPQMDDGFAGMEVISCIHTTTKATILQT